MYANSLQYTNTHLAWQQRVKRELGQAERFVNKGYTPDYTDVENSPFKKSRPKTGDRRYVDHQNTQTTWLTQSTAAVSNINSSFPIPFTRLNVGERSLKNMPGYMNDGTGLNISDPNSMIDQGPVRNAEYNFPTGDLPNGTISNLSYRTFRIRSATSDRPSHNNTFYSFGGRFTNIREHVAAKNKCKILGETMRDVKNISENKDKLMIAGPTAIMNDYTKNIS